MRARRVVLLSAATEGARATETLRSQEHGRTHSEVGFPAGDRAKPSSEFCMSVVLFSNNPRMGALHPPSGA